MSYGYSQNLVFANKKANIKLLGVALGRLCIDRNIPVVEVATTFKVSRMTVYNWFEGASAPNREHSEQIERFMARRRKK